jgi:hypothetical protein
VAGWGCLGELRQLVLECGVDFKGNSDPKAKELAELTEQKINTYCTANGITVRGGRFHGE